MIRAIFIAALFAAAAAAAAAVPQVTVAPERPRLGDPVTYSISFEHPLGQDYALVPINAGGPVELLSAQVGRADGPDLATTSAELRFAAFDLGAQTLPTVAFEDRAGKGERVTVPVRALEVTSTLPPNEEPKLLDLAPPVTLTVPTYRVLVYAALGLVALIGLGFLARKLWVRSRPPLPLDRRTHIALDALLAEELPEQGKVREFHFKLSDILRSYLAERFALDARECTTSELLRRLESVGVPLPEAELQQHFRTSDLARFARARIEPPRCRDAVSFGHRLVNVTALPPPGAADERPRAS